MARTLFDTLCRDLTQTGVASPVHPGSIKALLKCRYSLNHPQPLEQAASHITELLNRGIVHPNHPRHLGLFVPGSTPAAIVADTLTALFNPQLGAWWYAPAACEVEEFVLEAVAERIGFKSRLAHFTTGGAEANATGVVMALTRAFPEYAEGGISAIRGRPVFYVSDQAHDSFTKIAHLTGLGRDAVRRVPSDATYRMDLEALRRQYETDRSSGLRPFLAVATVGTTAAGAIDDVGALARFAQARGLWLHADAAWGGIVYLHPALKASDADVQQADSLSCDAHKILPVPVGAGMFFARHQGAAQAFQVTTDYLFPEQESTRDPYQSSMQWSRRFIGLKVFLTLAERGWAGIESMLERQLRIAGLLREELRKADFLIVNDTTLPLACFTHPHLMNGKHAADDIVDRLIASGCAWLSAVRLPRLDHKVLRACITNERTSEQDIRTIVSALTELVR